MAIGLDSFKKYEGTSCPLKKKHDDKRVWEGSPFADFRFEELGQMQPPTAADGARVAFGKMMRYKRHTVVGASGSVSFIRL